MIGRDQSFDEWKNFMLENIGFVYLRAGRLDLMQEAMDAQVRIWNEKEKND